MSKNYATEFKVIQMSLYRANEELLDPEKDIEISENYIKLKDYPKIEM